MGRTANIPFSQSYRAGDSGLPAYMLVDRGCEFSEGKPCLECPFDKCFEELTNGEKRTFRNNFLRDKPASWRKVSLC